MNTPDKWVIVKISVPEKYEEPDDYRVLGSWYGGYLGSDNWRMNSGIVKVEMDGDYYEFHGSSGSIYRCHKDSYGMSTYTAGVLGGFQDQIVEEYNGSMEVLDENTNWEELIDDNR